MKLISQTLLVLSVFIGLAVGSPVETEAFEVAPVPAADDEADYRLNTDVKPIHYELEIEPYFENATGVVEFTFKGVVKIALQATKTGVREIVLHQNSLDISQYKLSTDNVLVQYNESSYDKVTDKWTISLSSDLSATTVTTLEIHYLGYMKDDMNGFYRSHYFERGQKVWMASTQFQQTEARRAFPCFDEPGFKATFKLTMIRPTTMSTVSNTDIETSTPNGAKTTDVFKVTPPMSTYLLAFIVSGYRGNLNAAGNFGIYARPEAFNVTERSLKFGEEMLAKLGEYLNISYYSVHEVTKMDMAAIPDFSAGAMENWGLLTYRETNILYYPEDTPALNEQRIVAVIAHEQAHQWFGDLLTCNWWSETWLNEGFARYFQYFGTQMLINDWDLEEQFVVENLQQSMQLDSTEDVHAMTNDKVKTKADASNMFDNISYNKAASIIRMLSHYIGMDKFKLTLQRYLDDNRDKAVTSSDLFSAIQVVNPGDAQVVTSFFAPWTETPGFPLVTAELVNLTLKVTQKRFLEYIGTNHNLTHAYNIPITFSIDSEGNSDTQPKFVYRISDGAAKSFNFTKEPTKYYILNNKQTGFYRVNYEESNWMKIKEALKSANHDGIHVMNRAQIVDDLFNLAKVGIVKYNTAIDIISYIKNEKHYIPWLSAFSHGLTYLSQRVSGDANQKLFSWFIQDTLKNIYDHLTFEAKTADRRTDIYNRVNVISWACKYGHEGCIAKSKEHFNNFKTKSTKVPKDQRAVVYCNAVRSGTAEDFNFLYDRYKTEDISAEQLNLLAGMACTKDQTLVTKYLDYIIKTDDIRPQDRAAAINNLLNSNPEGPNYLYTYITANHAAWKEKVGGLGTLTTVAGRFTSEAQFVAYEAFLKAQEVSLGASYASMLDSSKKARRNLEFDAKYMKDFIQHLESIADLPTDSAPVKAISVIISVISVAVLYILN